MMADWDEIKRLAADFQRVQLSTSSFKLSERNCVEVIQKLIASNLLELIYTIDGKEYLTPQELAKEIKEELLAHNGRINLVDLQGILNVDFSIIEYKVQELVKHDKKLFLITGQLINEDYIDVLSEEINDLLQERGQLTVVDITKMFDLPVQFITEVFLQRVGTIIAGRIDDSDKDTIFTETFVSCHEAKICGYFSSLTRPTKVSQFIIQNAVPEHLFFKIVEKFINSDRLQGTLSGHNKEKAVFVPSIYTRAQNDWIDKFLSQNGYLEYDSLSRIGIADAKSFIKKRFKKESLHYLQSCAIGKSLLDRVEAEVEEAIASKSWVDISQILPSVLSSYDINELLQIVLKSSTNTIIINDTVVVSEDFIATCIELFQSSMKVKAEQDFQSDIPLLLKNQMNSKQLKENADQTSDKNSSKKEQRKKKATTSGKSSTYSTQGREVKTKSLKKKTKGKDLDEDSADEDSISIIKFMSIDEIKCELSKSDLFIECIEDFTAELAEHLERPLLKKYEEIFSEHMKNINTNAPKKNQVEMEGKLNELYANFKMYTKGIALFEVDEKSLEQHLLKTMGSDMVNMLIQNVAEENMLAIDEKVFITPEMRQKIISRLPNDEIKSALMAVHSSLNEKSTDEFLVKFDHVCSPQVLSILLKKTDKKKEKQLVQNHRQVLLQKLENESSLSLGLHISCVLIFTINTQAMLHIPGRSVPNLIVFLGKYMKLEQHQILTQCQECVIRSLIQQAQESEECEISQNSSDTLLLNDLKNVTTNLLKLNKQ